MTPLKITITLQSALAEPEQAFHLDALLSALRVKREEALGIAENPLVFQHDIPVEKHICPSGDWVFKASTFKILREAPHFVEMRTSRIDFTRAAELRDEGFLRLRSSKPNPAGGAFKRTISSHTAVWASLEAFCIGDKILISDMLADCTHVGGKRSLGYGRVKSITVEEIPEDQCHWQLRNLPVDFDGQIKTQMARGYSALRSPYWLRTNHQEVQIPLMLDLPA